jgi:hypothetical protein
VQGQRGDKMLLPVPAPVVFAGPDLGAGAIPNSRLLPPQTVAGDQAEVLPLSWSQIDCHCETFIVHFLPYCSGAP